MSGMPEYERDLDHWRNCRDRQNCARCFFEQGFFGCLRKGGRVGQPDSSKSWAQRFCFKRPLVGTRTWLAVAPYSRGSWGIGCWVCSHYSSDKWASSFSRLQVTSRDYIGVSAFRLHLGTKGHTQALAKMQADLVGDAADSSTGILTGVN